MTRPGVTIAAAKRYLAVYRSLTALRTCLLPCLTVHCELIEGVRNDSVCTVDQLRICVSSTLFLSVVGIGRSGSSLLCPQPFFTLAILQINKRSCADQDELQSRNAAHCSRQNPNLSPSSA